jgi:serine/threonine protein kinase
MLTKNPDKRITIKECLEHPWMIKHKKKELFSEGYLIE